MDLVRDRSSLALDGVVRKFEDRVRAVGRRFDLPGSDLDELFQEIRIRLWKALEDPERIDALSGSYVYRTATSAAVDLIRRRRKGGRQLPLDPNLQEANPSNPASQQEARETDEEVSRALQRLDERRRPVVRMYLAGYNHKEIADFLGWSQGSTRNLLYRGLADLRADLSGRLEGSP
ncbi:MAG: sigma-70 family RNA polymerase sigma factor [Longimicrobiales bacterium]|nr:sigma-70 family RNA polymerase sigma factor [Longimicrobiales bacterium]